MPTMCSNGSDSLARGIESGSQVGQLPTVEGKIHFMTECDQFRQLINLKNQFSNEINVPDNSANENQYLELMKSNLMEIDTKLNSFFKCLKSVKT